MKKGIVIALIVILVLLLAFFTIGIFCPDLLPMQSQAASTEPSFTEAPTEPPTEAPT